MSNRLEPLYRGSWFTISEFRCRGGPPSLGPEEASPTHRVALVRAGCFYRQVAGRKTLADANQVLFFNRDEPYRVSHPRGFRDECLIVEPATEALPGVLEPHVPDAGRGGAPFPAPSAPCSTAAFARQQRLRSYLRHRDVDDLAVEETTLALLDECLGPLASREPARHPQAPTRARHRELAEAVKELLSARLAEPLRLPAIGRSVGAAPFHLARLFRRETGLPIHRYRNRLRLRAALARIADGASGLAELALELGFSDHSHLTRAFRAEYGMPPLRWRQGAP